jgi:hypothetical protein
LAYFPSGPAWRTMVSCARTILIIRNEKNKRNKVIVFITGLVKKVKVIKYRQYFDINGCIRLN